VGGREAVLRTLTAARHARSKMLAYVRRSPLWPDRLAEGDGPGPAWSWAIGLSLHGREMALGALLAARRGQAQLVTYALGHHPQVSAADDILMAPPNLRVPDPSFVDELRFGTFGLAGEIADLKGRSPFAHRPFDHAWTCELHGFGWLRHLDAARSPACEKLARRLIDDWLRLGQRDKPNAWAPQVTGRRLISWLAHSALILDGADQRFYASVLRSLHQQIAYLSGAWQHAPPGYDRLLALIGLVLAELCIAGHDRRRQRAEKWLDAELERQILADGGHIDRNPETLIELVLDLLPLRQCFLVRGLPGGGALLGVLERMLAMVRHLRLGDGSLARFNGVGATDRDALATVLAYDKGHTVVPALATPSGYARLERGPSVVLIDVGPPPPIAVAQSAHAGCLAFELSVGGEPLLVNNGVPGGATRGQRAAARATASHNTLCLKEQSSSTLSRRGRSKNALPIVHPDRVTSSLVEVDSGLVLEATHDGYVGRWGLLHRRRLWLAAAGHQLAGSDALLPSKGVLRFAWDVPFAVHFHVHPDVEVCPGREANTADLLLRSGEHWRLAASAATLTIELSGHNVGALGARPAQQVVLRAACHGEVEVAWRLERQPPRRPAERGAGEAPAARAPGGKKVGAPASARPAGPASRAPQRARP
jgi:uncharacterized heparinase superfamily protein